MSAGAPRRLEDAQPDTVAGDDSIAIETDDAHGSDSGGGHSRGRSGSSAPILPPAARTSDAAAASSSSPPPSTGASSSSSSSSSFGRSSSRADDPVAVPIQQVEPFEEIPLAGEGGLFPATSFLGRCLQRFQCGMSELRLLLMILPCAAILLFSAHQTGAGVAMLVATVLFSCYIFTRLLRVVRARHLRAYQQMQREGNSAHSSLGALHAMRFAHMRNSNGRLNPVALRLAMLNREFTPEDYNALLALDDQVRMERPQGLSQAAINRLPTFPQPKAKEAPPTTDGAATSSTSSTTASSTSSSSTAATTCSVCLEPKLEGEIVRLLPCFHSFHSACITPWLRQSIKCPICLFEVQVSS